MRKQIQAVKRFLRYFIGDAIWVFRYYGKLKQQLEEFSITDVRIYKFVRWHSGFCYFIGCCGDVKVFIKGCCGKWNTIPSEAHLEKFSSFKNHPEIICYQIGVVSWIATKFMKITPIDKANKNADVNVLVRQLTYILDIMKSCGIIHRDLRPENICLDGNGNVVIIDFGWAIYKDMNWEKTSYELIEKILNQEYRDKSGKFDDAISVLMSLKATFPMLTEDDLKPITERIGRLVA